MIIKLIPTITKIPTAKPVEVDISKFFKEYLVEKGIINTNEEINHEE